MRYPDQETHGRPRMTPSPPSCSSWRPRRRVLRRLRTGSLLPAESSRAALAIRGQPRLLEPLSRAVNIPDVRSRYERTEEMPLRLRAHDAAAVRERDRQQAPPFPVAGYARQDDGSCRKSLEIIHALGSVPHEIEPRTQLKLRRLLNEPVVNRDRVLVESVDELLRRGDVVSKGRSHCGANPHGTRRICQKFKRQIAKLAERKDVSAPLI